MKFQIECGKKLNDTLADIHRLVHRAIDGDPLAREQIVELCRNQIERTIRRLLGPQRSEEDRRDALQRYFIALFESLHRYEGLAHFCAFANRIAYHQTQQYLQSNNWESLCPMDPTGAGNPLSFQRAPDHSPEQHATHREFLEQIATQLRAQLSDQEWICFNYHFVDALSITQIAKIMGLSRAQIDQRLHHIRIVARAIRDTLEQEGD